MTDLDRAVRLSDVPDTQKRMRRVKASVWMTFYTTPDAPVLDMAKAAALKAAKDAGAQDVTVRVTEEVP